MAFKNTLRWLVLGTGLLATSFFLGGCSNNYSAYDFEGNIGKERLKFEEVKDRPNPKKNLLTITRYNDYLTTKTKRLEIKFIDDIGDDLRVDGVEVSKFNLDGSIDKGFYDLNIKEYKDIREIAQTVFRSYLQSILNFKKEQFVDDLENP